MRLLAAMLLLGGVPLGALHAQDRTDIPQISETAAPLLETTERAAEPTSEAPVQLSSGADSNAPEGQLTALGTSHQQPAQVANRSKDPQAAEPLSTPQEGRTAAVEPVSGHDRCDPADSRSKASAECRKVIENRAAQYRRAPVTQLSPEQKLLIDQQLRANGNAAQQLARSGDPENNVDAMGIASIVLTQNQEPPAPDKKAPDAQTDAAVQAAISVLQGGTPQPQD